MRKLFILIVAVLFLYYCKEAHENMVHLSVPQYETIELDLLGGKTLQAWKDDQTFQGQWLSSLERQALQPMQEGLAIGDRRLDANTQLTAKDFEALIAAQGTSPAKVPLRDPAGITKVLQRNFVLRDPVVLATETIGAGQTLTKPMIDKLLAANTDKITIIGKGEPVAMQPGSLIMVMLIFVALTLALKSVLWDPVLSLVDERTKEIEEGTSLVRENRSEAARLEEEDKKLRREVRMAYLQRLSATQKEALKEGDAIYTDAKIEGKLMSEKARAELDKMLDEARADLQKQVPELAGIIAEQVLGRKPSA